MNVKARLGLLILLLILLAVPFLGGNYMIYIASLMIVVSIAALGLDILTGYAGQICFGQAGFIAVGAYCSAFLMKAGVPFWLSVPGGGVAAGLSGLIIGLPALRIRGHYLALATLSFAYIIHLILVHWESVTGGPRGLVVSRPTWPSFFSQDKYYYLVILFVAIILFVVARNIVRSRYGRAFLALQKDEIISRAMGINLTIYKTIAFVISSFYAGIAGGLYGPLLGFLDPLSFSIMDSAFYIMIIVIGGRGTLYGSIVGAAVYVFIPELLRRAEFFQELFFGVIFLCFLILMPDGVVGFLRRHQSSLFGWISRTGLLTPVERKGGVEDGARFLKTAPILTALSSPSLARGTGNELLQVKNLSIRFGGLMALSDVSFHVDTGEIFSLIGPNGAGKTSTLNAITRLYEPSGGTISFNGEELLKLRADQIVQKGIGRTFQSVGILGGLTALENVMVGFHASHRGSGFLQTALGARSARNDEGWRREHALEMLKLVNVEQHAFDIATDLPFGQQKLVGLARALACNPRLLILDEPASGLSPMEIEHLTNLIRSLCRQSGLTILLVEHDMNVVMGISDRIAVLDFGRRIAEGNPDEIRSNPLVVKAYLGEEETA